jgi:two-component system, OmpR family, sensor kinase
VPIKVRLTLVFVLAMAVVLVAAGLFVYLRFQAQLTNSIDGSLRTQAAEVVSLANDAGAHKRRGVRSLGGLGDTIAQVVDSSGVVVAGTRDFTSRPLVRPNRLPTPGSGAVFINTEVPGEEGTTRLIVQPGPGAGLYAIAGQSLSDRDEALSDLLTLLAIGGLAALALASVAGYRLAAGALRPVESMRSRAAEISHLGGGRLPVPDRSDEIGRLGTTLNEMLARLDAAIERERQFIADASHELRSPLTILSGELELAGKEGRSPQELRAAIASAAEETDRLCRLADDLLLLARSEDGRMTLQTQAVDVEDLFDGVARRFRTEARERRRDIVVDGVGSPSVRGDRTRLEQAVGNLVDNALRHGAGEVELSALPVDGLVRLSVRDHGDGFPSEFVGHAFERFARGDEGRSEPGAGLGLAIVDVIARSHGGAAGVANTRGGGARAWIDLPA